MFKAAYFRLCFFALSLLVALPAKAVLVTFIEESSSSLLVSADGYVFTVTNEAPDLWRVEMFLPGSSRRVRVRPGLQKWGEPSESGFVNVVMESGGGFFPGFVVMSDVDEAVAGGTGPVLSDGDIVNFGFIDIPAPVELSVRFIDLGDAHVPEPGSLALVSAGLFGFAVAGRKRRKI